MKKTKRQNDKKTKRRITRLRQKLSLRSRRNRPIATKVIFFQRPTKNQDFKNVN